MNRFWLVVFSVFLFTSRSAFVHSNCVWYGIGKHDESHPRYKAYTGAGKPLPDVSFSVLSELCPEYADSPSSPVCCDSEILNFFHDSSQAAFNLLRRCPSCWANFRTVFCAMTCSPDQAKFLETEVVNGLVESVKYNLTEHVAGTFYSSCKDVTYGSGRAIDMLCSSTSCTQDAFFKELGTGTMGPFPVYFKLVPDNHNTDQNPFDGVVYACNQSVPVRKSDVGGPACSCTDCEMSCVAPPVPPPPPEPITLLGINVWYVGAFIVFVVLTLTLAFYEITTRVFRCFHSAPSTEDAIGSPQTARKSDQGDYASNNLPQGNCTVRLRATLENCMKSCFFFTGQCVARHPYITLLIAVACSAALCCGLIFFKVTTNPVELWSAPNSRYRLEKNYFDHNFGPFYRTEQLIIRPVNQSCFMHDNMYPISGRSCFGPALEKSFLLEVFALQNELANVLAYSDDQQKNITLDDICFKPLAPNNTKCAITSPVEYFQNNYTFFNYTVYDEFGTLLADYLIHLLYCAGSPTSVVDSPLISTYGCLGTSGMPILPIVALGGFNGSNYNESTAVVLTFLVNNDPDPKSKQVQLAETWEAAFLDHIKHWADKHKDIAEVAYQAERSVEDEINRQSNADVSTVLISYGVMFIYVSIFLASYRSCRTLFVDLRITLGLGGVLIVIVSVVASVGIFSYFGVPATLIIIEVIPFLVLAVGVDNIFILVHDFEFDEDEAKTALLEVEEQALASARSLQESDPILVDDSDVQQLIAMPQVSVAIKKLVEMRVARTLGRVGPSLLLTSLTEAVAFFCGALTTMPAVKMFALYAGVALLFNFILQLTIFIALLTLDERRRAMQRFDVLCCFGLKSPESSPTPAHLVIHNSDSAAAKSNGEDTDWHSLSLNSNALNDVHLNEQSKQSACTTADSRNTPWLHHVIANWWTPFLLCGWVRPVVMVLSLAWLCAAVAIIPNFLTIGLDQRLAMPTNSYMQAYFDGLANDLRVGPPVYFVVTHGHDYLGIEGQNEICSSAGCFKDSLLGHVSLASKIPNYTRISTPASSWMDDYFDWIGSGSASLCCRLYNSNPSAFCPDTEPGDKCHACPVTLDNSRPIAKDFLQYLPFYLSQNPGVRCPKGGKAAYGTAVKLEYQKNYTSQHLLTHTPVSKTPSSTFAQVSHLSHRFIAASKLNTAQPVHEAMDPTVKVVDTDSGKTADSVGLQSKHLEDLSNGVIKTPNHESTGHNNAVGDSINLQSDVFDTDVNKIIHGILLNSENQDDTVGSSHSIVKRSASQPVADAPMSLSQETDYTNANPVVDDDGVKSQMKGVNSDKATLVPSGHTEATKDKLRKLISGAFKAAHQTINGEAKISSSTESKSNAVAKTTGTEGKSIPQVTAIGPTYFMAYHSVLQTPSDFIDALKSTRQLTDLVNAEWRINGSQPVNYSTVPEGNTVYAYSVFYVFNEQYLNIVTEAATHLSICLAAVTVVTLLLLGLNVVATIVVLFGVVYILVSLLALMALWGISLNAISLVNLVVAVGIAVEFCSHIVRAFTISSAVTRLERAKAALSDMGSSILRGITLTKLGGIVVLAFSQSQLFSIFYFRMYLGIIVFGAATGLLVLPVFLSYLGPGLNRASSQLYAKQMNNKYRRMA